MLENGLSMAGEDAGVRALDIAEYMMEATQLASQ